MAAATIEVPEKLKGKYPSAFSEPMTFDRAAKSAIMDTLGMALGPGAILNLTNNQMLKEIGKSAARILTNVRKYGVNDALPDPRVFKERVKSIASEIRSAPEGMFDPVELAYFRDIGSSWNTAYKRLLLDQKTARPRTLRHEIAHAWTDIDPDEIFGRSAGIGPYSAEQQIGNRIAEMVSVPSVPTWRPFYKLVDALPFVRKPTDLMTGHGYNPYELTAINQEYKPMAAYKDMAEYAADLKQSAADALEESVRRRNIIGRYALQHRDR